MSDHKKNNILKTLEPEVGIKCFICGENNKKLKYRSFQRYFGFIYWAWYQWVTGYMCLSCAMKHMIMYTFIMIPSIALHPGFWFFIAPRVFIKNLYNLMAGKLMLDEFDHIVLLKRGDLVNSSLNLDSLYANRFKAAGDNYWNSQKEEEAGTTYSWAIHYGIKDIVEKIRAWW